MLYGGSNILGFYEAKTNRLWETTDNEYDYSVFLETGTVPYVQLFVDASASATLKVYNVCDEQVGATQTMTVTDMTTYKRLKFMGATLTGLDEGRYYLLITNGADTYYSDVFWWKDDVSEYLKIEVQSSDVQLGVSTKYIMDMLNFIPTFYLNAKKYAVTPEIQETAEELMSVSHIQYSSMSVKRKFNVCANESIYLYLNALRVYEVNGYVYITWNGITYTAQNISVEMESVYKGSDLYNLNIEFKVYSDVISVINNI